VVGLDQEMKKNYQNQVYRIKNKYEDIEKEIESLNSIIFKNQNTNSDGRDNQ
jgi:hypothetical protein